MFVEQPALSHKQTSALPDIIYVDRKLYMSFEFWRKKRIIVGASAITIPFRDTLMYHSVKKNMLIKIYDYLFYIRI